MLAASRSGNREILPLKEVERCLPAGPYLYVKKEFLALAESNLNRIQRLRVADFVPL